MVKILEKHTLHIEYEDKTEEHLTGVMIQVNDTESAFIVRRDKNISFCENCLNQNFNETMGCKNYLQGFKCENFK